jgi:hypothetical protein
MSSGLVPDVPPIAFCSSVCYFVALLSVILIHFVLYSLLYTSLYIPNFTSSNKQSTASQVRHHNSLKNQEAHTETALARALQKTANLHCQSNV